MARLDFLTTKAGGRQGPTPANELRCIMTLEGENFDVTLHLDETGAISPGQSATVPVSFLFDYAKPLCAVGKEFTLRELRTIAKGMILEILFT